MNKYISLISFTYGSIWSKKFYFDFWITIIIAFLPFFSFFHLLFDPVDEFIIVFGYKYYHSFQSADVFIWLLFSNIIPLAYLLLMFLTIDKHLKYFLYPVIYYFISYLIYQFLFLEPLYSDLVLSFKGFLIALMLLDILVFIDQIIPKKFRKFILKISSVDIIREWSSRKSEIVLRKVKEMTNQKRPFSISYLAQLYYLNLTLDSLYINESNYLSTNSGSPTNPHKFLSIFILSVAGLLVYLDNFIPAGAEHVEIAGFSIEKFGFESVQIFVWYISQKLSLIIILVVWFIRNPHWWRYAILSPIILFTYQFWETFQGLDTVEDFENARIFPLVFLTIVFIMIISKVIRRRSLTLAYRDHLQAELDKGIEVLSQQRNQH